MVEANSAQDQAARRAFNNLDEGGNSAAIGATYASQINLQPGQSQTPQNSIIVAQAPD